MSWNALAVYLASLSVSNTVRSDIVLKGSNGYSFEEGYHHQFEFPYFELTQLHGESLASSTLTDIDSFPSWRGWTDVGPRSYLVSGFCFADPTAHNSGQRANESVADILGQFYSRLNSITWH
jgi:hypothetical protein